MIPPRISLVTPCFNGASYLEAAMRSVLDQGYGNLEYGIVDGGSSDGALDIIARHADRLAFWVSERDGGQYDALNKGFARTTGEIMGWLNADDLHLPWTLSLVADIFTQLPQIQWLTTLYPLVWDRQGRAVRCAPRGPYSRAGFQAGGNLPGQGWHAMGWIQQESTFWRRSLWEKAGGRLDDSLRYAGDFDLWARFFHHAELHAIEAPLAGFRRHAAQKTAQAPAEYAREALEALHRHGGRPHGRLRSAAAEALRRVCPNRLKPLLGSVLPLGPVVGHAWADGTWRVGYR